MTTSRPSTTQTDSTTISSTLSSELITLGLNSITKKNFTSTLYTTNTASLINKSSSDFLSKNCAGILHFSVFLQTDDCINHYKFKSN